MNEEIRCKTAIILAAGIPGRGFPPNSKPKCILYYRGEILLEHNVKLFKKNGISDIFVVVGYQSSKIEQFNEEKKLGLKLILNEKNWKGSCDDSFVSFQLGISVIEKGPFILCQGDCFFPEELLINLLNCKSPFCINGGGPEVRIMKLTKEKLPEIELLKKEIHTTINYAHHPFEVGFYRYLLREGAKIVPGYNEDIDEYVRYDEGKK